MIGSVKRFHPVDYALFTTTLVISLGIGVLHACRGDKQRTNGEYLMGNRELKMVPVAISMCVSFISAVSLIGTPAEMYMFGTQYSMIYLGISISCVIAVLLFVPLLYPLKLTSCYEYFSLRFEHKSVRMLGVISSVLRQFVYMSIVLYGPSTALEAVSEIPMTVSILVIGFVGVIYTFIGGMKAVVWTDVFQSIVMLGGLLAVIILGVTKCGGFAKMWNVNYEGGRISFFNMDTNPQTRVTFWGSMIGFSIFALGAYSDQTAVQRFCALPTIKDAKRSVLLNIPGMVVCGVMTCLAGMVAYAYYTIKGCDPYRAGYISNINQILPYFVLDVLDVPGLPGLFVASVFSASLSSISSSLNSVAAVCWEDILKERFDHLPEERKAKITKLIVLGFGVLSVLLSFFIATLKGTVVQICVMLLSALSGPVVGIWLLGGGFPVGNWKGALTGGLVGLAFSLWQTYGQLYHNVIGKVYLPTSTLNCTSDFIAANSSFSFEHTSTFTVTITALPAHPTNLSPMQNFYALSFLWNTTTVVIVTLSLGLIISLLTGRSDRKYVPDEYLFPGIPRFWTMLGQRGPTKEVMKRELVPADDSRV